MTIAFSETARDIVVGAMRDRRISDLDEMPEASELAYGQQKLDEILKDLAAEGVTPWTNIDGTATITAGNASATLSPRPIDVLEARLYVDATYERPMTRWEHGEYATLPNKAQVGDPLIYSLRFTPTDVVLSVWPVPSTDKTINYSYSRVIEDTDSSTAVDVPQYWIKGLREMLGAELTAFNEPTQLQVQKAVAAKQRLLDESRPESYILEPDFH